MTNTCMQLRWNQAFLQQGARSVLLDARASTAHMHMAQMELAVP